MGCFRFIAGLLGVILLVVGLVGVGVAQAPEFFNFYREVRELGGATTTLKEIADNSFGTSFSREVPPDLPVVVDGETSTTNIINAQPELEAPALEVLSSAGTDASVQEFEAQVAEVQIEAQSITVEQQPELSVEESQVVQQSLAENVVLDNKIEVAVVPLAVSSAVAAPNTSGQGGAGGIAGYEQRTVELEWPRSFRVGGSGTVVLTLKALPSGGVEAVAEIKDNQVIATPILITDFYDTHNARYSARLVAPDFDVETLTPQTQQLGRGEEGTWRWSLDAPGNSGSFVINLVINLEWQPKPNTNVQTIPARNIWGQALQVDVNFVFGSITVPQASTAGTALAVVGFAMQIPLLGEILGGVRNLLFGRRRKQPQTSRSRRR